ncbi:hypothetical protein Taro_036081 [Colocasia esculenta]|uniref:Uncharacterized protein n=1 Tax=Colocasia esculenta TaxID=4460 RepID=A0A843WCC1_COLES|nr:hypothetical protein [Colocasia esculenta]
MFPFLSRSFVSLWFGIVGCDNHAHGFYMFSMLPSPLWYVCIGFGVVLGRTISGCPSVEIETSIECHDSLWHRDKVVTACGIATAPETGETSQQRQGARRVEEAGR